MIAHTRVAKAYRQFLCLDLIATISAAGRERRAPGIDVYIYLTAIHASLLSVYSFIHARYLHTQVRFPYVLATEHRQGTTGFPGLKLGLKLPRARSTGKRVNEQASERMSE